jgi:hypothetical protein
MHQSVNYNIVHYTYYLYVKFFEKLYKAKGNAFISAYQLINFTLLGNIFTLIVIAGITPNTSRQKMYLFASLFVIPLYLITWKIFLSNSRYRHILNYFNNHEEKHISWKWWVLSYLFFSVLFLVFIIIKRSFFF